MFMKRLLLVLLAFSLVLSACGKPKPDPDSSVGDVSIDGSDVSTDSTSDTSGLPSDDTTTDTGDGPGVTQTGDVQTTTQGTNTSATTGSATSETTTSGTKVPSASSTTNTTVTTKPTTSTTTQKPTTTTTGKTIHLEDSEMAWYQSIVDSENAWLASMQLDNGALPMTAEKNGQVKVTPYFSDFVALSLLNQADLYADVVKRYMDWHFEHLNTARTDHNGVDGTIYDYYVHVSGGKVTGETILLDGNGKKSYDSTDSYAATFLMVLQKYVEKTGDTKYIKDNYKDIERIVSAMFATMANGLTLAKPDYRIKYLMDNCEVYEGMVAGAKLFKDVLVPAYPEAKTTQDKLEKGAADVARCIEEQMWNKSGEYYQPALGEGGEIAYKFSWSNFYPSATCQLFPIIHGLIDPSGDRANDLYDSFCQHYDWENFNIPDTFYWGSNVYTAAMMGDIDRVKTYMSLYEKVMKRHAYPLYNADAAKVCMAAYLITQLAG